MIERHPRKLSPVLIVEDSPDDLEAVTRAFRKTSIANRIDPVWTGEEALKYLQSGNEAPSLILLDLNLPGMGGRKTLETIKQDDALKFIPVVVFTTSGYEPDVNMCYALGANTFIRKPVDFDVFAGIIKFLKEYWLDMAILPNLKANHV